MAGDPNARRDKALADIAKHLGETNKLLKQIEVNSRPQLKPMLLATAPEVAAEQLVIQNPYDQPQVPQGEKVPEPGKDEEAKKFPAPTHPYLKRSFSVNVSDEVTEKDDRRAEGLGYIGPYGDGGLPYS
jgi:hypothetical protein